MPEVLADQAGQSDRARLGQRALDHLFGVLVRPLPAQADAAPEQCACLQVVHAGLASQLGGRLRRCGLLRVLAVDEVPLRLRDEELGASAVVESRGQFVERVKVATLAAAVAQLVHGVFPGQEQVEAQLGLGNHLERPIEELGRLGQGVDG